MAQKKANKIKQRIENKEKQPINSGKKEKKKGRGALQREKKRARKEAGEEEGDKPENIDESNAAKKQKLSETKVEKSKKPKMVKPQKKRKVDKDETELEDMIRSYKSTFSSGPTSKAVPSEASEPKQKSREKVVKKRWFE